MRNFLDKTIITTIATIFILVSMASTASAQKVIRLHLLNKTDPFDNPAGAMASVFKNIVESSTNGKIKVELFPNGQLGKDSEVAVQVRRGSVQSALHSVGGIASIYPLIDVLNMPYAYYDITSTYKIFDGSFGKKLAADIEKKAKVKVLGFGDSGGFYQFTNSKRPITSLSDFKGLKIRTQGLDSHKGIVSNLGGQPVAIAWAEVYTSLQTGVADGQMNPVPIIAFAKLFEVQKYLSITNHIMTPFTWTMNINFWESLSSEEQKIVSRAAKAGIVASRGVALSIEASQEKGLPFLATKMKVNSPSSGVKESFRKATQPAFLKLIENKYGKEGKEMLAAYLSALKEVNK